MKDAKRYLENQINEVNKCANSMLLLDLCTTNYLKFNGKINKRIEEIPIGSSISGLVVEAATQRLEDIALPIIWPKL